MKKKTILSAAVILIISFSAFSQKNVSMNYHYPDGKPVSYIKNQTIRQSLDIQGQAMDVYVTNLIGCNIKSAGGTNLTITVDTLAEVIDSPQGMMGGAVSEVNGKSFNLALKPNGKVEDLSGAKNMTFTIPGQGPANLSASFADFFPVLPEGKVDPGFTWNSVDTLDNSSGASSQVTYMTSENKFEGFEQIDGVNCAKITSNTTGTSKMKNEVQGMVMQTSGNFTGTETTWFSPESGYFIKHTATTKMTGNMEMPNEGYSFPVVMDINETTEVKK
ncbi:MAG TPA: hypothetical protein VHO46_11525 [Bacteroidales bacterium]|nr:hypothetical protein [Bacteroidales bacterium]